MDRSSTSSTYRTPSPVDADSSTSGPPEAKPGPRVLNLFVRAGAGHERAARAVEQAMRERHPSADPIARDALEFASPFFRAFYASSYNRVASRAPRFWGFVYRRSERQAYQGFGPRLRMAITAWNCRGCGQARTRLRADAVFCTQFLPAEIFAGMRHEGRLDVPVFCAITDFSLHPIWVHPGVDRYFVATESLREELEDTGLIRPERIEVSGVPIDPKFAVTVGAQAARRALHLDPDPARPTLLLMGGGFGWGPMEGMLEIVLELPERIQAIVVAGRNQKLCARLLEMA